MAGSYSSRPPISVVDRKGGIYFGDQISTRFRPAPAGSKPLLFYIQPDGRLVIVSEEVTRPNGVMLSPRSRGFCTRRTVR